jgi:hypothetical protein
LATVQLALTQGAARRWLAQDTDFRTMTGKGRCGTNATVSISFNLPIKTGCNAPQSVVYS